MALAAAALPAAPEPTAPRGFRFRLPDDLGGRFSISPEGVIGRGPRAGFDPNPTQPHMLAVEVEGPDGVSWVERVRVTVASLPGAGPAKPYVITEAGDGRTFTLTRVAAPAQDLLHTLETRPGETLMLTLAAPGVEMEALDVPVRARWRDPRGATVLIFTAAGRETVLRLSPASVEAPNWTQVLSRLRIEPLSLERP